MKTRIIKYRTEQERISNYVRNPQESINPDDASGSHYVDPAAILAEARATAEKKVQEAYAEGLRRGELAGQQQFEKVVGNASQMLDGVALALQEQRETFARSLEEQMVPLCELVTQRILGRELEMDPAIVHEMVRRALERLSLEERVRVRVNPNDYEAILLVKPEMEEQYARIEQLEIVPDASVESGGCVAESDALFVDAQLSSQLVALMAAVRATDIPQEQTNMSTSPDEVENKPEPGAE